MKFCYSPILLSIITNYIQKLLFTLDSCYSSVSVKEYYGFLKAKQISIKNEK